MPELQFIGKEFVYNHHLTVPYRPLVADPQKGIGSGSLDDNLIIYGDNLEALKALLPRYAGKVDCIFIDPPYNTGNEGWTYNDNVNSPLMREWLSSNPVNGEDMMRHDKWCCMMWPRLRLLYDLLTDDGSIWITLDDNENCHLRLMLDQIFGGDNMIASVAWEKVYSSRMDAHVVSKDVDTLLVYGKSTFQLGRSTFEQNARQFNEVHPVTGEKVRLRSLRKEGKNSLRTDRPNCYYAISSPDGSPLFPIKPDGTEGCWRWEEDTYRNRTGADPDLVVFVKGDRGWDAYVRQTFKGTADKAPSTLWRWSDVGHTHEALDEIKRIFGNSAFDTPKPTRLLEQIIRLAGAEDLLILDSFAGSGTTAHAAIALNERDGGNRRFILVECENYADTLTAERVRRVIKGYPFKGTQRNTLLEKRLNWTSLQKAENLVQEARNTATLYEADYDDIETKVEDGALKVVGVRKIDEKAPGLGGSFTYCTLGDPIDLDKILQGESLPSFENMAAWLVHTAYGITLPPAADHRGDGLSEWYVGETDASHVWLIYRPDKGFLQTKESALTLELAEAMSKSKAGKPHLVFASSKYVGKKYLDALTPRVEYAPLPFALYRIERGS